MPENLRDHLKQIHPDLATTAENLWLKSGDIHRRQNRPDSNENGRLHVEAVERNIWRLLTETRDGSGDLNLLGLKSEEVFLLSCAACCHDFDKGLKSANPLPPGFLHGEGSGAFVTTNAGVLGLDEHQARTISSVIAIHDLKTASFLTALKEMPSEELTPSGPINLRRVAVLLKTADILHCDYSRIQQCGIDPSAFRGLERKKYLARKVTTGWKPDGSRILIQAHPDDKERIDAFSGGFQFMKTQEWDAVAEDLGRWEFPHQLALHDSTARVLGPPEVDEAARPPTTSPSPPPSEAVGPPPDDLLRGYPEAQSKWVGRFAELAELHTAWLARTTRAYTVVGLGGQGKSALTRRFTETLRRLKNPDDRPLVVWWSFYLNRSADEFFDQAAEPLNIPLSDEESNKRRNSEQIAGDIIERMRTGVDGRRVLLVLDGLEVLQETAEGREGRIKAVALYGLLRGILDDNQPDTSASGMILITTRAALHDLLGRSDPRYAELTLEQLPPTDGATLLWERCGLPITPTDAEAVVGKLGGHALTLMLVGALLRKSDTVGSDLDDLYQMIAASEELITDPDLTTRREKFYRLPGYVLRHCRDALTPEDQQLMRLMSCCVRPATKRDIEEVFLQPIGDPGDEKSVNDKLLDRTYTELRNGPIRHLCELRLIEGDEDVGYDMHPLIRRHFYEEETGEGKLTREKREAVHARFFEVLPKRQAKHHPDTMGEMEPLIDAVLHGCRADLGQRAHDEVFYTRIDRRDTGRITSYLSADLGAFETHLQLLRAFFPDGDFNAEPSVCREASKGYLIAAAGVALMSTGRPGDAIPLFERGAETCRRRAHWGNDCMCCQNLSESCGCLGRLPDAFEAARNGLSNLKNVPASDRLKTAYTIFSHGYAAEAAARRGQDAAAAEHVGKAIDLRREDWLFGIGGACHCTWLARSGDFKRARTAGEKNAAVSAEQLGLHEQTSVFATQALVERLAWAAGDSGRKTLDEMQAFAEKAVEVGKRSGSHYYYTCALLEAGRCAVARAGYEGDRYAEHVARGKRYLAEAESRADYAGYRIIHADIHVTRAEFAKLAGDMPSMHEQCEKAIAICNDPTCDYAWAKQDAERLMANSEDGRRKTGDRRQETEERR